MDTITQQSSTITESQGAKQAASDLSLVPPGPGKVDKVSIPYHPDAQPGWRQPKRKNESRPALPMIRDINVSLLLNDSSKERKERYHNPKAQTLPNPFCLSQCLIEVIFKLLTPFATQPTIERSKMGPSSQIGTTATVNFLHHHRGNSRPNWYQPGFKSTRTRGEARLSDGTFPRYLPRDLSDESLGPSTTN